jgi:hypothetical protein
MQIAKVKADQFLAKMQHSCDIVEKYTGDTRLLADSCISRDPKVEAQQDAQH